MKIVLAGATGFIGSQILEQCIAHTFISRIFVLTRRPLNEKYSHKKVTQILHEDFEHYPEDLMTRLREESVDACIWAIGGKTNQFPDLETARRVGITYPIHAAEAFSTKVAAYMSPYPGYPEKPNPPPGSAAFPFRFIYVSGWGAEHNEFRKLWIDGETRRIKGAAEKGIFDVATRSEEKDGHRCFEAIALRPGGVLSAGDSILTIVTEAVIPSITVDRLARFAIKTAFAGAEGKTTVENGTMLGDDWAQVNKLSI